MQNIRPKIASLSEKELAQLLIESFFKVGRDITLPGDKLKIFIQEIYKFQGYIYVDTFSDAFSRFAACAIPEAETMRPVVSPHFIGKLMKLYFNKCNEKRFITNSVKDTFSILTPEEKYKLYTKYIINNSSLPANPDWIKIYEHLAEKKRFVLPEEWETMPFAKKLKMSRELITEWTCKHFNISYEL